VRQAKTGAVFGQKLNQARIVCKNINWPGFDLGKHAFMELLDLKRPGCKLSNTLTWRNGHILSRLTGQAGYAGTKK